MTFLKINQIVIILLLLFGINFQAIAGDPNKMGTSGAEELLISMGARGTALAGSPIAVITGIEAMYWNPAGVANTENSVEAEFSYLKYIADINISYGAIGTKVNFGTLGFSFQSVSFGDIPVTTEDAPEGTGSMFSPTFMTLAACYSTAMTDRTFVGVTAKVINEKIMETSATAFALDMGVQYKSSFGINIGIVLKNLGSAMQYSGIDLDREVELPGTEPNTPKQSLTWNAAKAELPSSWELGLSYDIPIEMAMTKFSVSSCFKNNNYFNDQFCVGFEMGFNDMFFARGGYDYGVDAGTSIADVGNYMFGPVFGFGLQYPIAGNTKIVLDFAYRTTNEYFDNNKLVTAKLLF